MFRRLAVTCGRVASTSAAFGRVPITRRSLCSTTTGEGEEGKPTKKKKSRKSPEEKLEKKPPKTDVSAKELLGEEMLNAVKAVAEEIHEHDKEAKAKTTRDIVEYLRELEKETFKEATSTLTDEMLADKAIQALLIDVNKDAQRAAALKPRRSDLRREREGMVLLRQEMFSRAIADGYKATEARDIAERAVSKAEERVKEMRKRHIMQVTQEKREKEAEEVETHGKEQKFYDQAFELAEKMLFHEEGWGGGFSVTEEIKPDTSIPLFASDKRLDIWPKETRNWPEKHLDFWKEWDLKAAQIANQSMGPRNAFEEQIEWTKQGKLWPYPIDNELDIGSEVNVPFYKHIFLQQEARRLGIPQDGPIGHFMELVCVGLTKNPYMTIEKKIGHLEWFANYFNPEKQKLIEKLHKQEQEAAASA